MRSVYDGVLVKQAVAPIAQGTGSPTTIWIDTLGYNSAMFVVEVGAATGTPDSYTVAGKVQESAASNGSGSVDVSGATITTITADGKYATIRVEGLGTSRLRYLGLVLTAAFVNGTSPKALVSGTCILGRGYQKPAGNSSTAS